MLGNWKLFLVSNLYLNSEPDLEVLILCNVSANFPINQNKSSCEILDD